MKKILGIVALLLAISPLAQAQVTFDSGSARPNNPNEANKHMVRKHPVKTVRHAVKCRDGSISYQRRHPCKHHRGIRR